MIQKINIGILGCANIADRWMIPAIKALSQYYNLIGIASRSEDKAIEFATKFNTKSYNGYAELLDESALEAVYIPLPNALHAQWIETAVGLGLHVLVEKSLACTYEDVRRLNEIANAKSLALVENFQFRFHSQLDFIQKLLSDGTIGELRCMRSSFGFPPFPDATNIRYQHELGGGSLLDAGAYPIKLSQIFLGNDLEVNAANLTFDSIKGVDIWGGAYLKQTNGTRFSEVAFGFDNFYQCNLELWGTKGKIYTNRIFTAHPDHHPIIELETATGKDIIKLPADHHFKNMLIYFHNLIILKNTLENEYFQNNAQAKLIAELKNKANE